MRSGKQKRKVRRKNKSKGERGRMHTGSEGNTREKRDKKKGRGGEREETEKVGEEKGRGQRKRERGSANIGK